MSFVPRTNRDTNGVGRRETEMKWINRTTRKTITNLVVTEVRRIYDFTIDEDGVTEWNTDYTSQDDLDVSYEYEDEDGNLCGEDDIKRVRRQSK